MKILYFYCGEGLGHSTPTIAAGKELEKKHDVVYASYGYAMDFGKKARLNVREIPSEIRLIGTGGKFSVSKSILETIKTTKLTAILAYRKLIKQEKPDLVITDSFIVPALIAKMNKIPVWMILNQTTLDKFFTQHKNPAVKAIGRLLKKFNDHTLKKMDKIIVRDFAPPNTICKDSLLFPKNLTGEICYIGPLVRKHKSKTVCKKEKKTVYSMIGGFGYRQRLLQKVIDVSKTMPDYKFHIVAGPNTKIGAHLNNVKTYGNLSDPIKLMSKSSIIIGGGGHSTAMEAISLGTPLLAAPDIEHFEQEANTRGIEKLGVGRAISYNTPKEELKKLIKEVCESKVILRNAKKMMKLSSKEDGRRKLLQMTLEFEKQLNAKKFRRAEKK